jgi:hypothetical protein
LSVLGLIIFLPDGVRSQSISSIEKHITCSCARLSFSILLQDKNVDIATIAYLMGYSTTKQVHATYRRISPLSQEDAISKLPSLEELPYSLKL